MLEQELAKLLEGTADAAFTVDLDGVVRTWNKAAEKLLGYPASSALGKPCEWLVEGKMDLMPVCRECCDILECARAGRDVSNYDMEIKTSSGQRIWVNISILVVANDRTHRRLIIHFVRDIQKRKRADDLTHGVLRLAKRLINSSEEADGLPPVSPLTQQERKILALLAAGEQTKEVARQLQISVRTLRNHLSHINQKLHTQSRLEATIQALKRGLI